MCDYIKTPPFLQIDLFCDKILMKYNFNQKTYLILKKINAENIDFSNLLAMRNDDIAPDDLRTTVTEIISNVKKNGDQALCEYTKKFDGCDLTPEKIRLSENEINVDCENELIDALIQAASNIRRYHEKQKRKEWFTEDEDGAKLGEIVRPVKRAGLYVPAGTAPLVSTVLMTVIPAQVAGVEEICVVTPPDKNGNVNSGILAACKICGVKEIYRIGSAWAVAALAFGTNSIKKVDVIAGPGNKFVTEAKRQLYGYVGIDLIAGPSESLIIADATANPKWVAADILSQAEHAGSETFLVSNSEKVLDAIENEIYNLLATTLTANSLKEAVDKRLTAIIVNELADAAEVSNKIAPEHLQIITEDNEKILAKIRNAGAIFLGNFSPVPLGDFCAGPSHVLPTAGAAAFMSGLSTDTFIKRMGVINFSKKAFDKINKTMQTIAEKEQLPAHKFTAEVRL